MSVNFSLRKLLWHDCFTSWAVEVLVDSTWEVPVTAASWNKAWQRVGKLLCHSPLKSGPIRDSLDPPESTPCTVSWSLQPFLQSSRCVGVYICQSCWKSANVQFGLVWFQFGVWQHHTLAASADQHSVVPVLAGTVGVVCRSYQAQHLAVTAHC